MWFYNIEVPIYWFNEWHCSPLGNLHSLVFYAHGNSTRHLSIGRSGSRFVYALCWYAVVVTIKCHNASPEKRNPCCSTPNVYCTEYSSLGILGFWTYERFLDVVDRKSSYKGIREDVLRYRADQVTSRCQQQQQRKLFYLNHIFSFLVA